MYKTIVDVTGVEIHGIEHMRVILEAFGNIQLELLECVDGAYIAWFDCDRNPGSAMQELRDRGFGVIGYYYDPQQDHAGYYNDGVGEEYDNFRGIASAGSESLTFEQRSIASRFEITE